jgi:dipeptide transport system substrate-binding protein
VSYEWAEYLERSKAKDRDGAVILGWTGDNGDPDNFLHTLLGCDAVGSANRARWCYQPYDDIVVQAKRVTDQEERTRLYEEAQVIFKEQNPWATIAHSVVFKPMLNSVKGFKIDPFGGHQFYEVDIEE